jgi:hypothetical protein
VTRTITFASTTSTDQTHAYTHVFALTSQTRTHHGTSSNHLNRKRSTPRRPSSPLPGQHTLLKQTARTTPTTHHNTTQQPPTTRPASHVQYPQPAHAPHSLTALTRLFHSSINKTLFSSHTLFLQTTGASSHNQQQNKTRSTTRQALPYNTLEFTVASTTESCQLQQASSTSQARRRTTFRA